MTDCQGTARPMEGDEYKVILWKQVITEANFILIFTFLIIHWTIQTILGRWSGLWRRSKIHICPYFGFTRIPKKRLSNAKSTFSIRFRTSHRWLGIYVLLCRKRFSTSPAQVSENEILDKLNIFIKVDKDLIMSCFFLLRLYGNVKSAMKFLLR